MLLQFILRSLSHSFMYVYIEHWMTQILLSLDIINQKDIASLAQLGCRVSSRISLAK